MIPARFTWGCNVAKKKVRKKATRKKPTPKSTSRTRWMSFRLPHDLVDLLDAHVKAERERTGYPLNRTQALVKIIRDALS